MPSERKRMKIIMASGSAKTICFHLFTDEGIAGEGREGVYVVARKAQ